MYIYIYTYIYVYLYTYIYMHCSYVLTYTHIYIRTYTCVSSLSSQVSLATVPFTNWAFSPKSIGTELLFAAGNVTFDGTYLGVVVCHEFLCTNI